MMDFSVNRVRSFSAFDMGLFKLTMFFLGMLFAVNMPRFTRRGKGLMAVVTAILTGTFLGYFFFVSGISSLTMTVRPSLSKKAPDI